MTLYNALIPVNDFLLIFAIGIIRVCHIGRLAFNKKIGQWFEPTVISKTFKVIIFYISLSLHLFLFLIYIYINKLRIAFSLLLSMGGESDCSRRRDVLNITLWSILDSYLCHFLYLLINRILLPSKDSCAAASPGIHLDVSGTRWNTL